MYGLGEIKFLEDKYPQAEALFLPVLEGNTRIFGPDHPSTLATMGALAQVYGEEGKHAEALAMYQQMYARAKLQGVDLPNTLIDEGELASLYSDDGQTAKAEEVFQDTLERMTRILGPTHPRTLTMLEAYAYFLENHGQYARAIPLEIRGRDASMKANGPDHRSTIAFTSTLGKDYLAIHQYQQAEVQFRIALASITRLQPESWKRYNLESMLGAALMGEHNFAAAEPLVLSGYAGLRKQEATLPDYTRPFVKEDTERVVQLYQAWGKPDKAAEWRAKIATNLPAETAKSRPQ
jgi:tetratricopeptide (TPR) repeat protein